MKWKVSILVAVAAVLFLWMSQGGAQDGPKKTKQSAKEIQALLNKTIEPKGLQEKVKFKIALEYLRDKLGDKVAFIVDKVAFADELGPDAPDIFEEEVAVPLMKKQLTIGATLSIMLSQVARGKATYVVRQGYVDITTVAKAKKLK